MHPRPLSDPLQPYPGQLRATTSLWPQPPTQALCCKRAVLSAGQLQELTATMGVKVAKRRLFEAVLCWKLTLQKELL